MRRLLGFGVNIYLAMLAVYLLLRGLFGDSFWWLSLLNTFAYAWFAPLAVLMPLALIFRHKQAAWRLMPVIALGGLWYAPYYLRRPLEVPPGKTISVVAANVWGHNHNLIAVEDWLHASDADIAILQEISPAYATDSLPNLRQKYPYQASETDDTRWGGNITLSRYPILSQEYVDLGIPDATFPLRVVLDVEGQLVAVYNVHLAWPGGSPRLSLPGRLRNTYTNILLGFSDRLRNQEIDRLLKVLETEPYPYIVAGDFNTSDQSATYGQIAARMTDSFREAGTGFAGSWPVSTARGLPGFVPPLIRIDYIWHSEGLQALEAKIGPAIGSDHLPVQATLSLNHAVQQVWR
jgi:endonuclease/exonuclease/phosphatase family metal-dependent hydrolase